MRQNGLKKYLRLIVRKVRMLDLLKKKNYQINRIMEMNDWLSNWYKLNCNGDWEHTYGIRIETLDNPGWLVEIDLVETSCEGMKISIKSEKSEDDWFDINADGEVFTAVGDPMKLQLLISHFKEFVERKM